MVQLHHIRPPNRAGEDDRGLAASAEREAQSIFDVAIARAFSPAKERYDLRQFIKPDRSLDLQNSLTRRGTQDAQYPKPSPRPS